MSILSESAQRNAKLPDNTRLKVSNTKSGTSGHITVVNYINDGVTAHTYLTNCTDTQKPFALKMAKSIRDTREIYNEYFLIKKLNSNPELKGIPIVYAETTSPYFGFTMDYLKSGNYRQTINNVTPLRGIEISISLCDILSGIHNEGIIHRDIKPENICFDDEKIRIIDFGLALNIGSADFPGIGTPDYMSDEQTREDIALDQRVDVYGLGRTLHESISGELPFDNELEQAIALDDGRLLHKVVRNRKFEPIQNDNIPHTILNQLNKVLGKMQANDREARFSDMKTVKGELMEIYLPFLEFETKQRSAY